MISHLKGLITEKNLDEASFVVEVNNIGYLVKSNLKFLAHFPLSSGESGLIKVFTSQIIKEDGHHLYGFKDKASRDIFEILISVNGVGPKAALSILNILELDELIAAVLQENPKLIAAAQGIGPKTAQRIILELQNKIKKFNKRSSEESKHQDFDSHQEAYSILANLGYSEIEIERSISKARDASVKDKTEDLVQFCIKDLSALVIV